MLIKVAGQDISEMISYMNIDLGIGEHSKFTFGFSFENRLEDFKGSLAVMAQKWIGKPLEVQGLFKGIVTSLGMSRTRAGGNDLVVRGYSQTILLDDGIHSRSFGEKPLKVILNKVIEPYKSKFSTAPNIGPNFNEKIKYCVQYRESNFQFMNRLAARYGEWFYYDGLQLHFTKPQGSEISLNFEYNLDSFNISLKTTPVNFKLLVYDYKKHDYPSQSTNYPTPENEYAKIAFDKSKNDIYPETTTSPISLGMNEGDLEQIKNLRQNVHLNELVVLSGSSSEPNLRLGSIVRIVDNRTELRASGTDNYGKYIITQLTHNFHAKGEGYNNQFEAIPADAAIPPLSISPDPPSCEMQLAEVVDNNDPDSMGRVRVQFIWQKEATDVDDIKTNWIRVATPQGGGEKGFYMLPEIADTVLVAFEHNHPERAYVLTGMYHGKAKPEHHDPNNYQKSWKTKGGNFILMNDEAHNILIGADNSVGLASNKVTLDADEAIDLVVPDGDFAVLSACTVINATTSIELNSKGELNIFSSGPLRIEAPNISIKGTAGIKMEAPKIDIIADGQLSLKGAATSIKGSAMMDVESSGITSVSAPLVKIN
jgi:type VI secretion system secreted protein VgrG